MHDAVIIGGGFSGLEAARRLAPDHDIVVLEARERAGGRVLTHTFSNGDQTDLGGQWVGPGQDRLYALIAAMGFTTWPLWDEGDHLVKAGRLKRYRGTIPNLSIPVLLDLNRALSRFEAMARQLDPAMPWAHPKAQTWDRMNVADFLNRHTFTARAREMFTIGIGAVFCAEPHELSLLHALFYARSGRSLDALLSVSGGAQQDRVHGGGMGGLATALAASLGDRVRYGEPVQAIGWGKDAVTVTTNQQSWRAKRVILAIPPSQALGIHFDPALPASRDALWRRMPAGACIKCVAQYERPFWRDRGLSGQAVGGKLAVRVTFDNTERGKSAGQLLGFIEGEEARRWSDVPTEQRRDAVLDAFAGFFGEEARVPVDYADKDWTSDPWTRGCYASILGPGVWTTLGENLRKPIGPVHVAGTETAVHGFGYIEGALEAGARAADEVRAALS